MGDRGSVCRHDGPALSAARSTISSILVRLIRFGFGYPNLGAGRAGAQEGETYLLKFERSDVRQSGAVPVAVRHARVTREID